MHTNYCKFLETNQVITQHQSGFRKLHSTTAYLLNVTNHWLKNIDQGLLTGIVFIDLRKAFDKVDVDIVLR